MLPVNRRILIVDDNIDIHNDFKKILGSSTARKARVSVKSIELELFDDEPDEEEDEPIVPELADVVYELDFAFQGKEAIEKVHQSFEENRPYALVFMDVRMPPGLDGIETIARIWNQHPNVEMVICTAYSDYSFDGVLEKLGTTDRLLFLTKPFDSIAVKQMALSLSRKWSLHEQERHQLAMLENEARQRRESEGRLYRMIHYDHLTGLANRRQLTESIGNAIMDARSGNTRFALFFIELTRFNEIIDTLGYQIGDQLILRASDRLKRTFSSEAELFRLGVSEFALLVPKICSLTATSKLANRIQQLFEVSFELDDLNIDLRISVAVVIYPDHGANADMLTRHADMTLLYARKSEQSWCYYNESMNKFSPERLMLLSDLKSAILNDDLLLYFQPKLHLPSGQITGVEALIRWAHATQGFVPPANFIPLAEQCGLIRPLTRWVLNKVSHQWLAWRDQGLDLNVSLNLTAHDLADGELTSRIREVLDEVGMPPEKLGLEISERGVMMDREQAALTLQAVSQLGVRLTIDNFGTGYSSLVYLKNLPVNEIKIDSSFILELKDNANELAIVRSMVELGHDMGLEVTAEGVSTPHALELMTDFACDYVQGMHINAPVPAGELALWLQATLQQSTD